MPAHPRTVVATVTALAALGAFVTGCSSAPSAAPAAAPVVASSPAAKQTSAPAPRPSSSTVEAITKATATRTATTAPRPTATRAPQRAWVPDPWDRGYEFGLVWGARRSGGDVLLEFDPAGMLMGDRAEAYYDEHPDEPRIDYKILNDKGFSQTLRVPASAAVYGNQRLGPQNGSQNTRLGQAHLVTRTPADRDAAVVVWLKRTGKGPVVYLAEQYLP